jgi:hypothetical protein
MSAIKKNSNFNIFKKNLISPFTSCLNGNGNQNLIAKTNKINNITKSKIMSNKSNKSSLPFPKNSNYITLISPKNTSSLFLDHTFMTSKSIVLSKLQNKSLLLNPNEKKNKEKKETSKQNQDINIKIYLQDLKKTFDLNIDIISKMCNKDKKIASLIEEINKKLKHKETVQSQIEKIKGKMIIEKQIQSEHIRKLGENEESYKEQINLSLDKITIKDEYIIILMKKLKELEIYSKRKSSTVGSGFEKYKHFKVADFIDFNTKYLQQKNLLKNEIEGVRNNIKEIKKENNKIKDEYEKINNKKNKKEKNYQKYLKYYNYNCDIISSKIKLLKNTLKQISKKYFFIKVSPKLKDLIENEEDDNNKNKNDNVNKKRNFQKRSLISNVSTIIDLTNMNNDMTKRLESFIDLSIILNDNNDITNIFDTISHGNIILKKADFGKVSKIK